LARAAGRLARLRPGGANDAADAGPEEPTSSGGSVREELVRRLAEAVAAGDDAKAVLDAALRQEGADRARAITAAIRPALAAAEWSPDDAPWRAAARVELEGVLAASAPNVHGMAVVREAWRAVESAAQAAQALSAVAAVARAADAEALRLAQVEAVRAAATGLLAATAGVRSADLAGRCAQAAEDALTSCATAPPEELGRLLSSVFPALRAEVAGYEREEARQAERRRVRRIEEAARRAVRSVRTVLEDSPSWQVVALDKPDRLVVPGVHVDGFLARQIGDRSSAVLIRAAADGGFQVEHLMVVRPGGDAPADQETGCHAVTELMTDVIEPVVRGALGAEFTFSLRVDPERRGIYKPTAREQVSMDARDKEVAAAVQDGRALRAMEL
jgi:hypothetical protein